MKYLNNINILKHHSRATKMDQLDHFFQENEWSFKVSIHTSLEALWRDNSYLKPVIPLWSGIFSTQMYVVSPVNLAGKLVGLGELDSILVDTTAVFPNKDLLKLLYVPDAAVFT